MLIFLPIFFLVALVGIFLVSVFTGRSIVAMGEKWLWWVWTIAGLWAVLALIAHLFKFDLYAVAGINFGDATILANVVFVGGVLLLFRSFIHKMAVKVATESPNQHKNNQHEKNYQQSGAMNVRVILFILGIYTTVESLCGMIGLMWAYSIMVNHGELKTPDVNVTQIFSSMIDKARVDGAISGATTTQSISRKSTAVVISGNSDNWKAHIMSQAAKKGITASTKSYHGMTAKESLGSIIDAKGNDGWVFCKNNYTKLNEKGLLNCSTGYVFR